jgi:hypothetical protein
MDTRTTEILNWLDEMATTFSLRLDKKQKILAEDAIKAIMKTTLAPIEEEQKFEIPPELESMTGSSVVSVETPCQGGKND